MVMKFIRARRECRFKRGTGNYHSITALGNQTTRHHWHSPRKTLRTEILLGLLLLTANKKFILIPCTLSTWMLSDQFAPLILQGPCEERARLRFIPAIPLFTGRCSRAFMGDLKPGRRREGMEQTAERQGFNPSVTRGRSTEVFPGLKILVGFLNGKIRFSKQQGFLPSALMGGVRANRAVKK